MATAYGLDISDRSLELIGLSPHHGGFVLRAFARVEMPPDVVVRGAIRQPDALIELLNKLLVSAFGDRRGTVSLGVSFPEQAVFSKTFSLPGSLDEGPAAKAAAIEAEDVFPLDLTDAATDYLLLPGNQDQRKIFFAAADAALIQAYGSALHAAKITPLFLEPEGCSLARAFAADIGNGSAMILDIGGTTTTVYVCDRTGPLFSASIFIAGNKFSAVIEQTLGVSPAEAERLKHDAGLDAVKDEDGKVYLAIEGVLGELLEQVRTVKAYCEAAFGKPINRLLLVGGSSLMPGISEFFSSNLPDMTVLRPDPFFGVTLDRFGDDQRLRTQSSLFAVAVGLAKRAAGARTFPGLDLDGKKRKRSGPGNANFFHTFTRLTAMVTPKKTQRRAASPKKKTPPDMMPLAPESESTPQDLAGHDYGQGVGQLLGAPAAAPEPPVVPEMPEVKPAWPMPTLPESEPLGSFSSADRTEPKAHGSFAWLIVLGVALFIAAVAGVYMFFLRVAKSPARPVVVNQPEQQSVTVAADMVISADPQEPVGDRPFLVGRIVEIEVSSENVFDATGETTNPDAKSSGSVTITNTTDKKFTFVASTRFLSKEGILFRLVEKTLLPADGTVEALVVADQSGVEGDIAPTTFTIPGLGPTYEQSVFAESKTAMSGGSGTVKVVTQEDIAAAKLQLEAQIQKDGEQALAGLKQEHETLLPELITTVEILSEAPAPGTPGAQFTLRFKRTFKALLVPENSVQESLKALLPSVIPASDSTESYLLAAPKYTVRAYEAERGRAEVHVEAQATRQ